MKFGRVGAVLLWLTLSLVHHAPGQEPAQTPAGSATLAAAAAAPSSPSVPPAKGSQIPHEKIGCAACHTEPILWEEAQKKFYLAQETLAHDVHWQKGVACSDCHGGNPTTTTYADAHAGLVSISQLRERCGLCHKEEKLNLIMGVHAKAGNKDERGRGQPLDCSKCHGANPHEILAVNDKDSPVRSANQVHTCGACHAEGEKTYAATAHGKGLFEAGLKVTAVCADCHGSHGIFFAADRRSTLNPANVANTCSKCHQSIEGRLQSSVHGRNMASSTAKQLEATATRVKHQPVCTDCHLGHPALSANQAQFRLPLVDESCGNCHAAVYSRYSRNVHSVLTDSGFAPAAKCSDCHGSHSTLAVNDPKSRLAAGENRLRTCQQCHAYAVSNFAEFHPHANFKDAAQDPELNAVYEWVGIAFNVLFICYFFHAILWFARGFFDRLQHGGDPTLRRAKYVLPRFGPLQRELYVALLIAFLGLTVTGLSMKYSDVSWGQQLARGLGGFRSVGVLHQSFAMFAIVVFAIYVAHAVGEILRRRQTATWKTVLFGPDSLLPNSRDVRDFCRMLLWFIGFDRKPGFERWAYWEKLDYCAFFLVVALIGFTGVALWFPNVICLVFPGSILNIAKMLHSQYALYIASVLFVIHFFHAHLRPEKFPMDLSVITGLVSEEHLRKYRPDYIARLEREGKLEELRQAPPSRRHVWVEVIAAIIVFTCGLCLLVVAILASLQE